jgi:hypothetical protein
VNDLAATVVPWLHPATGLLAVALLVKAARRGLAVRSGPVPDRHLAHPRLAFFAWLFVLGNWGLGLLTVWAYRPELELAASTHFKAGTALLGLLTLAGVLSFWIFADPRVRRLHPVIGAAALLVAGIQVFLGLQMTRW